MSFWNTVRAGYRRLTLSPEDDHVRAAVDVLGEAAPLRSVPRRALRVLAEAMHERTFQRGEFLYYEDDPGLGLYVVQEGQVRLLAEDDSGERHELRQPGPGEVFGDLSILGDFPRMETAQALIETSVLGFFRPDLKTMRQRHPKAAVAVIEALAQHLARRQVEVMRQVAEDGGRIRARRMLERTAPGHADRSLT